MTTLLNIRATYRLETTDNALPYAFTDAEIDAAANEAQNEACRRARLLVDSTTTAICQLTITPPTTSVTIDPRVIFIRRVRVSGQSSPLMRRTIRDMDDELPGWEQHTGRVERFITDWQTGSIKIHRIPTVSTVLNLTVVRLPLIDMVATTDSPEINARFHLSLLHWIKYRAYIKPKTELHDEALAAYHLSMFEAEFGTRSSAFNEEWIEREQMADSFDGTY